MNAATGPWVIGMGDEERQERDDVLFLFDSGLSPEQIARIKQIPVADVEEVIQLRKNAVRKEKQQNIIQDISNNNPWKDGVPNIDVVREVVESVPPGTVDMDTYGARTVPSRPIKKTDRSDRVGEDTVLTDRVQAAAETSNMDEEAAKIFEDIEFERRQKERKVLEGAMKDIKDMVDDDLEF